MKLTATMLDILADAAADFGRLPATKATRRALWARGLIEPNTSTDGPMTRWRITPDGRAAIAQAIRNGGTKA